MRKKLIKHGNSAALILDKPILELLHVTFDTPLEITTDGRNIVVSPVLPEGEGDFAASLERINERLGSTLKRLAE